MNVQLRKKKLSNGKISLYLDIYNNGQRSYDFLKLYLIKPVNSLDRQHNKETLQLAESIKAKKQLELQSNNYDFLPAFKKQTDFIEYFENFISKASNKGIYKTTLFHFKALNNKVTIAAINERLINDFKEYLLQNIKKQNTAAKYFVSLKTVLNQAVKDKIISSNPFLNIELIRKNDTERSFLTIEELRQLSHTDCKHPEIKRAFFFACYTGLRISDIIALRWSNIVGNNIYHKQKKTKELNYLPLNNQALTLLGLNSSTDSTTDLPVFKLGTKDTIAYNLLIWAKDAGIKKHVTFHTSRHTFATLALSSNVDLYTVSKLLGHSSIAVTQVYAKIIDRKKVEAVNSLPELNFEAKVF